MKKVYKVDYWSKGNAKLSNRTVSRKYLEKYITVLRITAKKNGKIPL